MMKIVERHMRKTLLSLMAVLTAGLSGLTAQAQAVGPTDPTYPPYRIRYLADLIEEDQGSTRLIEEGVFNTEAEANQVINLLAHLAIAWRVDCACEEVRRDVFGAADLEDRLMEMLRDGGYVSRLVPAAEVGSLPDFVRVLTPYLLLNGDGYRGSNPYWSHDERSNDWGPIIGGSTTSLTLDPSNPRQYARVDFNGIYVDTRLDGYVDNRIRQLMGAYRIDDPASLCAFAALERSPDDMMSWVLIRDLRRTWGDGQ